MIELEKVVKIYPNGTNALRGISFSIEKGELCVVVGPSGCGKTTLLKLINRLIPLTSGKILIEGVDVQTLNPIQLRRRIGYAIQEVGLFPHMTVRENILTVPKLLKWPKEKQLHRAYELCELVGLIPPEDFLNRYPSELSGGQRQRVGVARALGADPPVLLMDEPFGALDPITREKLQDEFLRIQAEIKKTVVFVTHDVNEAIKMGDKIALLREGKLIQYATPVELLFSPKDNFVRDFVGADRTLKALRLLKVWEIMDPQPPKVRADQSLAEAVREMDHWKVNFIGVVDQEERFLGWLTRPFQYLVEKKVAEVMAPCATLATPNMPVSEALSKMLENGVGNLAVVQEEGKLVGLITFERMLKVLRDSYLENKLTPDIEGVKDVSGCMGVDK